MAKKKLGSRIKRRKKRVQTTTTTSRTVVVKRNPAGVTELAEFAIPGFAGYGTTKFVTKLAAGFLAKKYPTKAKHGAALVSVLSTAALWWFGNRVKIIAKYQMPAVVGSAIASLSSLLQLYFPNKLGWLVGDPNSAIQGTQLLQQQIAAQQAPTPLPDHLEEVSEDPRWYTYNDAYDAGRLSSGQGAAAPPATAPIPSPTTDIMDDDETLANGIFGGGLSGN